MKHSAFIPGNLALLVVVLYIPSGGPYAFEVGLAGLMVCFVSVIAGTVLILRATTPVVPQEGDTQ